MFAYTASMWPINKYQRDNVCFYIDYICVAHDNSLKCCSSNGETKITINEAVTKPTTICCQFLFDFIFSNESYYLKSNRKR